MDGHQYDREARENRRDVIRDRIQCLRMFEGRNPPEATRLSLARSFVPQGCIPRVQPPMSARCVAITRTTFWFR